MTDNLYLVFSRKPDAVGIERYHEWYTEHARENIESPGFVSAQRYVAAKVESGEPTGEEEHLAMYRFGGDMSIWRNDLDRRIESGDVVFPPWFDDIGFTSWACRPVGGLLVPDR